MNQILIIFIAERCIFRLRMLYQIARFISSARTACTEMFRNQSLRDARDVSASCLHLYSSFAHVTRHDVFYNSGPS